VQLLLKNIKQLVTVAAKGKRWKTGHEMRDLGVIENASVLIDRGTIRWIGIHGDSLPSLDRDATILEAHDLVALPGFVDAHTHLVFAGSREDEFALRAQGKSYQEIAEEGGGILSTVRATRAATKRELKRLASRRLDAMLRHGTTTVEIKSGYGLDEQNEIKILETIAELRTEHLMTIVPTFLGAHALPPEFKDHREQYIELLCSRMLPYIGRRHLAGFCDVFCDNGYFTVEESTRILATAREHGLKAKIHADELSPSGGSMVAGELQAISADHLEYIDDAGVESLRRGNVVAVLLPGVSLFLRHSYAPARRLVDAGIPVALASDFNPGSCMLFSIPLILMLACTQMSLTPEEAISAATLNAAAAVGLSERVGSIEIGKQADIVLYDVPNYRYLPYYVGINHVKHVIKNGILLEF
jgi:imidazolonepropionase